MTITCATDSRSWQRRPTPTSLLAGGALAASLWLLASGQFSQLTLPPQKYGDGVRGRQLAALAVDPKTIEAMVDPKTIESRVDYRRTYNLPDYDPITAENPDVLKPDWWQVLVDEYARTWEVRRDHLPWCSKNNPHHGMFFVKTPKTGSSAAAAVSIQIAENVARRDPAIKLDHCRYQVQHAGQGRDPARSVMWTTVREPASHARSYYFFGKVSRNGEEPSAGRMVQSFEQTKNFQTEFISKLHRHVTGVSNIHNLKSLKAARPKHIKDIMQDIITSFDFMAVTERMDESLVVLKLLLGLEDEDIVNMSHNKHAGGFDDGQTPAGCVLIAKGFTPPEVQPYIDGEFHVMNFDYFLYALANRSLDLTIDSLGRDVVERGVARLRRMQALVARRCEARTVVPCTEAGPPNPEAAENCYFGDVGCGHACAQEVLRQMKEGTLVESREELELDERYVQKARHE